MELTVLGMLAAVVVVGSVTVAWGGRYLHLPASVLAVAFTVTALSWLALLVGLISLTMRSIALASL